MNRPDRVLVVRSPGLCEQDEDGDVLRRFAVVVEAVEAFCPWVTAVRPGVCSLPARGPARYFGGEERLVRLVGERVTAVTGEAAEVGVADGLFGALLAAGAGCVVPASDVAGFLAPFPVSILGNADLAELLGRLGIRTLGSFAALPEPHVLGRFGADGVAGHRVAGGRSGEIEGLRDPAFGRRLSRARARARDGRGAERHGAAAAGVSMVSMADVSVAGMSVADAPVADAPVADVSVAGSAPVTRAGREVVREVGFWGGASDADERAAQALATVQSVLGPDGVVVARLQGGRGPAERVRFVTWSAGEEDETGRGQGRGTGRPEGDPPWPGRIPPPAPALVHRRPRPAELQTSDEEPVRVSGRGLLSAPPVRLSVGGDPWVPVVAWAGPWPTDERWWSRARRRGARLQVVTGAGTGAVRGEVARLLVAERGRWWVEATYA